MNNLQAFGHDVEPLAVHCNGDRIVRLTNNGMETVAISGLYVVISQSDSAEKGLAL
jgi:hypothetical protein